MPKAPSRCSKVGCRNFIPCRTHPRGWASSTSAPLPGNWSKLRRQIKSRKNCALCSNLGSEVDHIICRAWGGSDSIDNLQLLCYDHHKMKSQEESHWGNKKQTPDLQWWVERWT